ncbi:junctional adhesion molecule 2A-like [Scylla paramamosain]|uniref:junctional adhesion molecule 2A-like n=1 Tax=Scylla paramamosain TaxID=85552 RepID=UPI0030831768
MTRPGYHLSILVLLLHAATSIKVEKVEVPRVVRAGESARLECLYQEDGDKLYSLKWWRGDDQFYQYVPPSRNAFPVNGVAVNLSATATLNSRSNGKEVVMLERVGLDSAGVYKCEVMADTSFQTEFREANMTVIYVPDGPPTIAPALGTHSHNITVGQRVTLRCSSRPANPPPLLTWLINGRHVNSSWVSVESPVFQRDLARVSSKLTFPVTPDLVVGGGGWRSPA